MSRWERYGTRDLFFSGWHRFLPDDCTMIDLDGVEYCQRCRHAIALFETCRNVQERKTTTVLELLAADAGKPAYLIQYEPDFHLPGAIRTITRAWITRIWPPPKLLLGEFGNRRLQAWFVELHRRHECNSRVAAGISPVSITHTTEKTA